MHGPDHARRKNPCTSSRSTCRVQSHNFAYFQAAMRDAPGTETSGREDFEYDSLDPESRSIRLLQIIPAGDSKEQIQCTLRLGSTVEQYTCLSYVWGDPEKGQWILVNGRRLWVRQNLHSFLDSARKMPELTCPGYWIWIDAKCNKWAASTRAQKKSSPG
jgi:hypothetical protein